MKIGSKLIFYIAVPLTIISIVMSISLFYLSSSFLEKREETLLFKEAEIISGEINERIRMAENDLGTLTTKRTLLDYFEFTDAGLVEYADYERRKTEEDFLKISNTKKNYATLNVINLQGKTIVNIADQKVRYDKPSYGSEIWFKSMKLDSSDIYKSGVFTCTEHHKHTFIMSKPFLNELGHVKGFIIFQVHLADIFNDVIEKIPKTNELHRYYVVAEKGIISESNDKTLIGRDVSMYRSVSSVLAGEKGVIAEIDEDKNISMEKAYIPLEIKGTGIIVSRALSDIFEFRTALFYILFFFFFLLLLILTISMYVGAKKITIPIAKLALAAEEEKKNLDANLGDEFKGRDDEVGELASSFSSMVTDLKSYRHKLEEYSLSLEKKVKQRTRMLSKKEKELSEANVSLEDANKKLKELDIKKDEFISVAAHELKTPLTSIKGFTQLLQDETVQEDKIERKHFLELINRNTSRLYNLVLDLVDSSRLSIGKLQVNLEEIDANLIFNEIKEDMGIIITNKGLKPEFSIEKDIKKIYCDQARTLQILRNIVINAVHYTEKGSISLKISKKGDFAQFEVTDTGSGIPPENQKNLFSRFYQVDSSLTRKIGGSGLGLSICKGLVDLMGGKIWFVSRLGEGSTFLFTIPLSEK